MARVWSGPQSVESESLGFSISDFRFAIVNSIANCKPQMANSLLLFLFLLTGTLWADLSETRKILGFYLCRGAILAPDGIVNFFAMDADLFGSVDSEPDFVAS